MGKEGKMITVFITIPWFAPAWRAGGPVQSIANLVAEPADGVDYRIFCGAADWDGSPLQGIQTGTWTRFNPWTQVWYAGPYRRRQALVEQLQRVAPDVLYVNGIYDWSFNLLPLLFGKGIRRIVSVRGMLHPGALSQKGRKKKLYLRLWKTMGLHRALEFHAATVEEKGHVEAVFGKGARVHVAANLPRTMDRQGVGEKAAASLRLVTVALVSPMKNILLVLQALKGVTQHVEYHLYGPVIDPGYWEECRAVIRTLPAHIQVRVHGELPPADLPGALERGEVFILPSRSENFCHAIYEALTAGKPVITSHHTPWNGLQEACAGLNVGIDAPGEVAAAIGFFAGMTGQSLETWSMGARRFAEARIHTPSIRHQYQALFLGEAHPEKQPEIMTKTTEPC